MRQFERLRQRLDGLGNRDQVDMIRHQAVAHEGKAVELRILSQQLKVSDAIAIAGEDDLSCIAPLRNMMGNIRNHDTRQPGHSKNVTEKIRWRATESPLVTLCVPRSGEKNRVRPVCPQVSLNKNFITGRLAGKHYYDAAHREYNQAVRDLLKLDTEEGQTEVARDVLKAGQQVLDSTDPRIKGFIDNLPKTESGMTGREALQKAVTDADGDALGEFVGSVMDGAAEWVEAQAEEGAVFE